MFACSVNPPAAACASEPSRCGACTCCTHELHFVYSLLTCFVSVSPVLQVKSTKKVRVMSVVKKSTKEMVAR